MSAGHRKNKELYPSVEAGRLETLSSYRIMDSGPEKAFDRTTQLAADIFSAPIAAVSLIDEEREWFKSAIGFSASQIDRDVSLSASMVADQELIVIEDAEMEPRFARNPLVSGEPSIRFYAATPLCAPNGMVLGALWIGDIIPRSDVGENQLRQLKSLAAIVTSELELRREIHLREQAQKNAAIDRSNLDLTLALSDVCSFRIDLETGLIEWGGAYMKIWGKDAGEALVEVESAMARIHPDDRDSVRDAMSAAAEPGEKFAARFRIVLPSGETRWLEGYGDYLETNGRPTLTGINKDITHSVDQQEQLTLHTRELHHRLRNLFATLQSILVLTKGSATSIDDYIERIKGRLSALNRAQQILLDTNFVTGSFAALVRDLCRTYPKLRWSGPDFTLSENAMVSISLVLNELATNAAKYGALANATGYVAVEWKIDSGGSEKMVTLSWTEHRGPAVDNVHSGTGFGSSLIDHSITRNLRGEIKRDWTGEGLRCTIVFPVPEDGAR